MTTFFLIFHLFAFQKQVQSILEVYFTNIFFSLILETYFYKLFSTLISNFYNKVGIFGSQKSKLKVANIESTEV